VYKLHIEKLPTKFDMQNELSYSNIYKIIKLPDMSQDSVDNYDLESQIRSHILDIKTQIRLHDLIQIKLNTANKTCNMVRDEIISLNNSVDCLEKDIILLKGKMETETYSIIYGCTLLGILLVVSIRYLY
jgi:hypothetical protein